MEKCEHAYIRGVYGEEINASNARTYCLQCSKYIYAGSVETYSQGIWDKVVSSAHRHSLPPLPSGYFWLLEKKSVLSFFSTRYRLTLMEEQIKNLCSVPLASTDLESNGEGDIVHAVSRILAIMSSRERNFSVRNRLRRGVPIEPGVYR